MGDKNELMLDGGIRRGTDILKALAQCGCSTFGELTPELIFNPLPPTSKIFYHVRCLNSFLKRLVNT